MLEDLLTSLIALADKALPGKTGAEKEAWATERLYAYIEANDSKFLKLAISFTRLPIPSEIVDKIIDNGFADGLEKQAVQMICKTAIRVAYGIEFIKRRLPLKELTEEEQKDFDAAAAVLLAEDDTKAEEPKTKKTSSKN